MNSADIARALTEDAFTSHLFAGVYPFDQMVDNFSCDPNTSKLYVFNTHESLKPGEHWIAVHTIGDIVNYFDSFGRHPGVHPRLADKFRREAELVNYNQHLFQNLSSTACGDYCILFCFFASRGWSMQRYVDWLFSLGDSERRDHILRQILIERYGKQFYSSYRQNRSGLSGAHNLHNIVGQRAIGQHCPYTR